MYTSLLGFQGEDKKYEYGIFNADKEKICEANQTTPDDKDWAFLWAEPIGYTYMEPEAIKRVEHENERRIASGEMETHGPVMYRRRQITVGPWEL